MEKRGVTDVTDRRDSQETRNDSANQNTTAADSVVTEHISGVVSTEATIEGVVTGEGNINNTDGHVVGGNSQPATDSVSNTLN